MYPNPNNGTFTIINYSHEASSNIIITDLTGKAILSKTIINNQPNEVNLLQVENGIYLLQINGLNTSQHSKVIISR